MISLKQLDQDIHFMKIANLVSEHSKCLSRKVGAVLVKDDHIIASGYNNPPLGTVTCEYRDSTGKFVYKEVKNNKKILVVQSKICPRKRMGFNSGEGLEYCTSVHAEMNAILQAAKVGISTNGSTLYGYCQTPCPNCAKELINAGVKRIVCLEDKEYFSLGLKTKDMLRDANVKLVFISEEDIWQKR